jgi:hypothetical protein
MSNEENVGITNSASDWVESMWGGREPQDARLKQAIEDACDGFDTFAVVPVIRYEGKVYPVVTRKSYDGEWDYNKLDEFGIIYHITMKDEFIMVRGVLKEELGWV